MTEKSFALSALLPLIRYLYTLTRSLLEPYLFQVDQSQLSQTHPTWHMLQSLTHLPATQIVTDRPLLLAVPTYIATKAHIKSTDSEVLFLLSSWPGLKLTSENTRLYSLNLQVHSYSQLLCISAWPLRTCNTIFRLWVLYSEAGSHTQFFHMWVSSNTPASSGWSSVVNHMCTHTYTRVQTLETGTELGISNSWHLDLSHIHTHLVKQSFFQFHCYLPNMLKLNASHILMG